MPEIHTLELVQYSSIPLPVPRENLRYEWRDN